MDKKRRKFLKYIVFLALAIPVVGLVGKLKPFQRIMKQFEEEKEEEVY